MQHDHIPAAVDTAPDADYIDHTIPAGTDAVNSVDVEALTTELDTPWPPPDADLIEQSIPVPLDDDR